MVEKLVPTLRFLEFNENWEEKSLGEILSRRKEKHKISKDTPLLAFAAGQGVIDRSERKTNNRDFLTKDSKNKTYLLTEYNDIVYNPSNLKYGAIDRNSHGKGVISPIYVTFVSNVSPLFMEYIVKSYNFKQKALKYEEGTVIKRQSVHPKDLVKIKIKIPKTESERIKIGTFLSSIDKKMELLEKKHDKFQNFKKYLMQQIFTQKLRFNFTDEWKKSKLKEICNVQDGTHTTPNYVDEGIPFYSVENLTSNVPPKFISKEEHEKLIKRCKPKFGDILITRIGTLAKSKVIDWEEEFSIYVSLALLSSIKINARFLNYYIQTDKYQKDFLKKSLLLAVPQKINLKDLNETIVEYPSSKEQEKIVNVFDSIDTKIAHINIELNNTKNFKRGLLQQMFI